MDRKQYLMKAAPIRANHYESWLIMQPMPTHVLLTATPDLVLVEVIPHSYAGNVEPSQYVTNVNDNMIIMDITAPLLYWCIHTMGAINNEVTLYTIIRQVLVSGMYKGKVVV